MIKPIRFVPDIGLWAFSRGNRTCKWRTEWCVRHCYNAKFYRLKRKLPKTDRANEMFWQETPPDEFCRRVSALRVERFRFAVCGEIWTCKADVTKVSRILRGCKDVLFWIPTRAWRDGLMRRVIGRKILPLPNARVLASLDPTTSVSEEEELKRLGWSTVFVGDNSDPRQLLLRLDGAGAPVENRTMSYHRCSKTWDHEKGACAGCRDGCFSAGRVDVHLRRHY